MIGTGLSRSATVETSPLRSSPVNFMVSAVYMTKKSLTRETGFGFLYSNNMTSIPFLPVVIWNENINEKNGVEIALPYKLAWRHSLSSRDIFHLKAEGSSRSYYVSEVGNHQFRRTDLDLGLGYTRIINRWTGVELFSGFRQNLQTQLPCDAEYKTMSGFVASIELFRDTGV
ncbi:MAG: hypothetical protein HC859_09285 [Bacteroidia bacterium]|nr:hypothetical protein [Bacteroidia bacterium]